MRNAPLGRVLDGREIGCWVFDEAHCLSKWGRDFRPDYLYAGRFIKDLAKRQEVMVPPAACFTATAKRDVTAEILAYFREHLDLELRLFEGGVERDNLAFEVQVARVMEKPARVHAILQEHLAAGGAAIVYASTRQRTEELLQYLRGQGWAVEAFHAGVAAPEKRRIQDAFVAGQLRVICATNAFGMWVAKEDGLLVVHLDIYGSLENYVQEAGRAGRARLSILNAGDELQARAEGHRVPVCHGDCSHVARLSKSGSGDWLPRLPTFETIKIVAMLRRRRQDGDPAFRERCHPEVCEVPLVEIRVSG